MSIPMRSVKSRLRPGIDPKRVSPVFNNPACSTVPESPKSPNRQPGPILVPALTIGGLSITLAVGLTAFKAIDRANLWIATLVSRGGREAYPKHLPDGVIWLAALVLAFFVAFAILSTPGTWRKLVVWISAAVLTGAWAPVLSLAAHSPDIAAPWIATVWSGVCALVYATNHRVAMNAPRKSES